MTNLIQTAKVKDDANVYIRKYIVVIVIKYKNYSVTNGKRYTYYSTRSWLVLVGGHGTKMNQYCVASNIQHMNAHTHTNTHIHKPVSLNHLEDCMSTL